MTFLVESETKCSVSKHARGGHEILLVGGGLLARRLTSVSSQLRPWEWSLHEMRDGTSTEGQSTASRSFTFYLQTGGKSGEGGIRTHETT
jgi:hypothetical protein